MSDREEDEINREEWIDAAAREYAEQAWGPYGSEEREKGPTRALFARIVRKHLSAATKEGGTSVGT